MPVQSREQGSQHVIDESLALTRIDSIARADRALPADPHHGAPLGHPGLLFGHEHLLLLRRILLRLPVFGRRGGLSVHLASRDPYNKGIADSSRNIRKIARITKASWPHAVRLGRRLSQLSWYAFVPWIITSPRRPSRQCHRAGVPPFAATRRCPAGERTPDRSSMAVAQGPGVSGPVLGREAIGETRWLSTFCSWFRSSWSGLRLSGFSSKSRSSAITHFGS
jgi:hypothetical protein